MSKKNSKEVHKYVSDAGQKITHLIHKAEAMNLNDLT